jgi:hypothetical protein
MVSRREFLLIAGLLTVVLTLPWKLEMRWVGQYREGLALGRTNSGAAGREQLFEPPPPPLAQVPWESLPGGPASRDSDKSRPFKTALTTQPTA